MRFLLINQFFAPDLAPTAQLLSHVACGLASQGHDVSVISSRTAYAGSAGAPAEIGGVKVRRVPSISFGRGNLARVSSYASFYAAALPRVLFGPRYDAILTLTTPPLLSLAGTLAKRFRGCRHFIWEMDMYPDIATAVGLFAEGSLADRALAALGDFSRVRADRNIVLGPCMRDRLLAHGIPESKIAVAENWIDGSLIAPRPFPESSSLEILYFGNLGLPHDVETVAAAMQQLGASSRFRFSFTGGGSRHRPLEERCRAEGIANAVFRPYRGHDCLSDCLGGCHVGLVMQEANTSGALVPSKTYAFMAAGRPFLFIGPADATPARIIDRHRCGWHIEPGDVCSLVKLLEFLDDRPDLVRAAGARARNAFVASYERETGVRRILEILTAGESDAPALPSEVSTQAV